MRIAKNVFLVLGILCILMQFAGYLATGKMLLTQTEEYDIAGKIAYHIGYNFFLIIGVVFLLISYGFKRKIKRTKVREMVDSLFVGQDEDDKNTRI